MQAHEILDILLCPSCGHEELKLGSKRRPTIDCPGCGTIYPIIRGIPDMVPRLRGKPLKWYRIETLYNRIARFYDYSAVIMSFLVWKCEPLRYVDASHHSMGNTGKGMHLEVPIGTGLVPAHTYSKDYMNFPIIGVDISWKMLRRAQKRFRKKGIDKAVFIRAEPEHLPFKKEIFSTVQSINGIHGFIERELGFSELLRVTADEGLLSGTTLFRGEGLFAEKVLDLYERWGIFPMLRGKAFASAELEQLGLKEFQYQTHGAVMFFSGKKPLQESPQ